MALWKESVKSPTNATTETADQARLDIPETRSETAAPVPVQPAPRPAPAATAAPGKPRAESLIAPDITIEGKIEGAGHVRIAGSFKGDINVRGDLTIEAGAKVTGSVRAEKVTIAGELVGNIESAAHVELLQSGALAGDLKAASLSVAAGSRMRGQVEFGWDDKDSSRGHGGAAS